MRQPCGLPARVPRRGHRSVVWHIELASRAGAAHAVDELTSILERNVRRGPSCAYVEFVKNNAVDDEGFVIAATNAGVPIIAAFFE